MAFSVLREMRPGSRHWGTLGVSALAGDVRGPLQRAGLGRRGWPFAVVLVAGVGATAIGAERSGWFLAGAALLAGMVVAAVLVPWDRLPRAAQVAVPLAWVLGFAVLRYSHDEVAGVASLLAVPVVWAALYGSAAETLLMTGVTGVLVGGAVVVHGYPDSELRRAFALLLLSGLVAGVIRSQRAQALHDPLTGLLTRRAGERALDLELHRAGRLGIPFTAAMLDLDEFKSFNDAHGHQAGDRVLEAVGRVLRAATREIDVAVRWGGEEFLLGMSVRPDEAEVVVDRLRSGMPEGVRFSAGLAAWQPGETLSGLAGRADTALYAAKGAGRDATRLAAVGR